jgi:hypothetical protein
MEAVRQFHKVANGVITIQLPVDFAADEVEVIILPKPTAVNGNPQEPDELQRARKSFLSIDTSNFTPEQMKIYNRNCERVRAFKPGDPRLFGLYEGLIWVADDFDAPLPDDIVDLFYGSETDEYGLSLPR